MSKPITHALFVIDMSGSMHDLAEDVRGGFNAYVEDLRTDTERKYRLTVTLFDDRFESLCVAARLADVLRLDRTNYVPRGRTALLDAIGKTIGEFERRVPDLGAEDRVLLVVQTDGAENNSREYTKAQITEMIRARVAGGKWSAVYLAAGPEAFAQAGGMGFDRASTVLVAATSAGTRSSYDGLAAATRSYSRGGTAADAAGVVADGQDEDA